MARDLLAYLNNPTGETVPTQAPAGRDLFAYLKEQESIAPTEKQEGTTPFSVNLHDYTPGKYDNNIQVSELDNLESIREANQGVLDALGRSTGNLVGKTGLNVVGAVAGTAYGIVDAIANGEFRRIYDNDVSRSVDKASEAVGDYFKVYKSADYEDKTLLGRMFLHPIQFADEFMDTLSFTTGAVLTELLTAGVGSAMIGAKALKYFKTLDKTADAVEVAGNLGNLTNKLTNGLGNAATLTRQLVTGASWEASVEARQATMALRDKMYADALVEFGAGSLEELPKEIRDDIDDRLADAGMFTFLTNLALVGGSNIIQFPKIFGQGYNTSKKALGDRIVKKGDDFVDSMLPATRADRITRNALTALKNPFMEGIVEEGGQSVLSQTAGMYWDRKNNDGSKQNVDRFLESFGKSLVETYTTGEGWYDIGMGMLIGSIGAPGKGLLPGKMGIKEDGARDVLWTGGIVGNFQQRSEQDGQTAQIVDELNKYTNLHDVMKAHYNFLVESGSINKDIDRAVSEEDIFNFNNYKDDLLHSYIKSRINAGLIEDIDTQLSQLQDIPVDDFYVSFKGEEALTTASNAIKEQFKRNSIQEFKEKSDNIIKAYELVDDVYEGNNQDLREELAYTMASAKNIDVREKAINNTLSDLSSNQINNLNLRGLDTLTVKEYADRFKLIIADKEASKEAKQAAKESLKNLKELQSQKGFNDLSVSEIELIGNFIKNSPVEASINLPKIVELLADSRKLRDRRHLLIGVYNNLFTKEGQARFEKMQKEYLEAKEKEESAILAKEEKDRAEQKTRDRQAEIKEKAEKAAPLKKTEVADAYDNDAHQADLVEFKATVEEMRAAGVEVSQEEIDAGMAAINAKHEALVSTEQEDVQQEEISDAEGTPKEDNIGPLTIEEKAVIKVLRNDETVKETDLIRQDGLVVNDRTIEKKNQEYKLVDVTRKRSAGNTVISLNIDYVEGILGNVATKYNEYNIYDQLDEEGKLVINPTFDSRLQDPDQFTVGDQLVMRVPAYAEMVEKGVVGYTESRYNIDLSHQDTLPIAFYDANGAIVGYLPTRANVKNRVSLDYIDNALIQNNKVRSAVFDDQNSEFMITITDKSTGTPMFSKNRQSIYKALGDGVRLSEGVKITVFKEGALREGLDLVNTDQIKLPEGMTWADYFMEGATYSIIPSAKQGVYYAINNDVSTLSRENADSIVRMLQLFRASDAYGPDASLMNERNQLAREIDFSNVQELMGAVEELIYVNNESDRYMFDINLKSGKLFLGMGANQSFDLNDIKNKPEVAKKVAEELAKRYHAVKLANFGKHHNQYKLQEGKLVQIRHKNYNDYLDAESVLTTALQSEPIAGTDKRYFTAQSVIEISNPVISKQGADTIQEAQVVPPEGLPAASIAPKRKSRLKPKVRSKVPVNQLSSDYNEISIAENLSLDQQAEDLMNKCK